MSFHALSILNPASLISSFGLVGVYAIIFVECALIIGFFLPGDSLLFVAGVAASSAADKLVGAHLNYAALLVGTPIVAIVGSQIGHYTGARFGRRLFDKPDSRFFKRKYAVRAEFYFNKYGGAKAVLVSRFIVGVRTFVNPLAGMLEMPSRAFLLWSTIGNIFWVELMLVLGHELGAKVKGNIDTTILPIAAVVAVITLIPLGLEMLKERRAAQRGELTDLQRFEQEQEEMYYGRSPQQQAPLPVAGARHRK
ncbi:MAG TPA: DedA family protein [Actinocrinis sp.]|uniref:DedA family protein n=1 Tax=Actinocrinis sp. TaxID=1920516 RepID=UPI002D6EFB80|nr:DedA family protein [Actinocrinis sp.]HZU55234.1 DedA family protein [Actinocrinis sp.]